MRALMPLVFVFLVIGCTSIQEIDTHNKRVASIETAWGEALATAIRWREEGRLSEDQRNSITTAVLAFRQARENLELAESLAAQELSVENLTAVLVTLQAIVREVEVRQ